MTDEPMLTDRRPPPEAARPSRQPWLVLGLMLALALAAAWWYRSQPGEAPPPATVAAPPPASMTVAPPAEGTAEAPLHPIEAAEAPAAPGAAADPMQQLLDSLAELLGRDASALLQLDGLVRRVVATVDNLPRAHAPSMAWPVLPTAGRFQVQGEAIAPANAARYAAFMALVDTVDLAQLAAIYRRHYPLFQQTYADLGFPQRYFNDRLVFVIDHLIQTPEPAAPPRVVLVDVKGDVPSLRPWVRYEYADPALQSLSAGQKLLVRMGPANERRLKARLSELRRLVARAG